MTAKIRCPHCNMAVRLYTGFTVVFSIKSGPVRCEHSYERDDEFLVEQGRHRA